MVTKRYLASERHASPRWFMPSVRGSALRSIWGKSSHSNSAMRSRGRALREHRWYARKANDSRGHLPEIFAMCGMAIALPLYSLFGSNTEVFLNERPSTRSACSSGPSTSPHGKRASALGSSSSLTSIATNNVGSHAMNAIAEKWAQRWKRCEPGDTCQATNTRCDLSSSSSVER